ncbi:hypothetical protein F5B19DRAFT_4511 [Rostrohypoxylon terebratum]|nr:hypothetical protein F5B19DRAFT_4511 [Rostrohypoxylon terebratum]
MSTPLRFFITAKHPQLKGFRISISATKRNFRSCTLMPLFASNVALATIVCISVFSFIAIIFIAIHVFVRVHLLGQVIWAVVNEGQGEHFTDITRSQFKLLAKSLLVNEALWALVNGFVRFSASLFIYRLFHPSRRLRLHSAILICISVTHTIAALMTALLICRPIQASWNSQIQGTCGNQVAAYVGLEAGGLFIDIYILALPITIIPYLHLSLTQKVLVLSVLSVGAVVMIITAFRMVALHRVNSSDFSYDQGYLGLLSVVGALLSIISCCAFSLIRFGCYLRSIFRTRREEYPLLAGPNFLVNFACLFFKSKIWERIYWMYLRGAPSSRKSRNTRSNTPVLDGGTPHIGNDPQPKLPTISSITGHG